MHYLKGYTSRKKFPFFPIQSNHGCLTSHLYIARMKKVLVTGGAGYIGSHTVIELLNSGFIPVIVDDFSNSDERILSGLEEILGFSPVLYRCDCTQMNELRKIFQSELPDAVIHFAAFKAVGESTEQPVRYYRNNIDSLLNVLELMQEFNTRDLVFSSSCTVYGQPDDLPVRETSPQKTATSPYGYSKQVCERILEDFCFANQHIRCTLLRYFNPIGAHPSGLIGELPYGTPNNLVPYITQTAAGIREKLTIHGNDYNTPDGTCIRDYIHVCDLANAHVKALEWLDTHPQACEAFNLGQGLGNSVKEVVDTFVKVNQTPVQAVIGPRRAGDVEQVWADVSKASEHLNWHTTRTLAEALKDSWRWQKRLSEVN
jgi:UDP-glucose 4-epimerase